MASIPGRRPDRAARLRELADRWMEVLWRRRDVDAVERLHAPGFVDRSSAGRKTDSAAFRDMLRSFYAAFPDFHAVTEDLVIDPSTRTVAIRWSATGTHRGAYLGVPPSGRSVSFRGIEILRFRRDRVAERWGEWDGFDLLGQLGKKWC
jgi:steroid delta-isomerase-like uncharacterized protein